MGGGLAGVGQTMTEHRGLRGTFATGVLAVIVASPCTAPFMGTALGFALTRPPLETLLVFAALGIGFALPVTLLGIWPRWVSLLPAPGPWMERLRNALAFPLYATAAWLLWVLSQQVGPSGLAGALAGSVLLAFGLWWLGQPLRRRGLRNALGGTLVVASLALMVAAGRNTADAVGGALGRDLEPRAGQRTATGRPRRTGQLHRRLVYHLQGQRAGRADHRRGPPGT